VETEKEKEEGEERKVDVVSSWLDLFFSWRLPISFFPFLSFFSFVFSSVLALIF